MKKIASLIPIFVILFLINVNTASAHVSVSPKDVGVATTQSFTVSVPTEKDSPTIQVRLLIPEELENVRPNVKPGWKVELRKTDEKVTEIIWRDGSIPVDLRDEFVFRAKAPTAEAKLVWKAYQTYEDGTEVSWDLDPDSEEANNENEESDKGPYSITKVIDDLTIKDMTLLEKIKEEAKSNFIADVALIISVIALILALKRSM